MVKRTFDVVLAIIGSILATPIVLLVLLLIYLQDGHSPLYLAPRVGKSGKTFKLVKLRSMVVGADRCGADAAPLNDPRITRLGRCIRTWKIDELVGLINVLKGEMSIVGPRPSVLRQVEAFTPIERRILSVKPGITDLSSIVFFDQDAILAHSSDPDREYDRVIRPWKSRLGLLYVDNQSLLLDVKLVLLTAITLCWRRGALIYLQTILDDLGAEAAVKAVARRDRALPPFPPPGADHVTDRPPRPDAVRRRECLDGESEYTPSEAAEMSVPGAT